MADADPDHLARLVAGLARPLLIGLDIDGVLSPLVAHADDATLLDGIADQLQRIANRPDVEVAAISGRSLASIATFGLPVALHLVGSHGIETADSPIASLDADEQARLDELRTLAEAAVSKAGAGAWAEFKPASVAVHIREADPDSGHLAIDWLSEQADDVDGATAKPGASVLELFARHASKGTALAALQIALGAEATVFVGDDVTDEEAFAVLGTHDVAIKVGNGPTIASHHLADPVAVRAWLTHLADQLESHGGIGS